MEQHQHKRKREEKEDEEESENNELLYNIMAGYSDKTIPPLTQFSPSKAIVVDKGSSSMTPGSGRPKEANNNKQVTESMKKERERRDKMAKKYDLLLSMVPNLPHKAKREMIVAETTAYIQSLEKEIIRLERLKGSSEARLSKEKMHLYNADSYSSINVTVSSNVAFFGIQSINRPRLVKDIFMVFHKHKAEVLEANVVVNQRQLTLTVIAVVNGNTESTIQEIKREILIL